MSHPLNGTRRAAKCECGHFAPVGEILESCPRCDDCHRHTGEPPSASAGYDPQTPVGAEAAVQAFRDALEPARVALAEAMDAEVEAKLVRDAVKRRWILSEECPRAGTFDGVRVLASYVDAWVGDKIVAEQSEYERAQMRTAAALSFLEVLGKQLMGSQTLAKSVGQSYGSSTGSGRW